MEDYHNKNKGGVTKDLLVGSDPKLKLELRHALKTTFNGKQVTKTKSTIILQKKKIFNS